MPLTAESSHADEAMRVEWNRELMGAVASAYASLLGLLPRQMQRQPPETMYRYFPTVSGISSEELHLTLLTPLYAATADSPLFLAQSREVEDGERAPPRRLCQLEEGLLLPSGLDARLEAFVRQHFTIFDLPQPLAEHLIHHGPPAARPFTPLAMRQYLKRKLTDPKKRERRLSMGAWDAMHSATFVLDLLALCVDDLNKGTYAELDELYLLPLAKGAQVR